MRVLGLGVLVAGVFGLATGCQVAGAQSSVEAQVQRVTACLPAPVKVEGQAPEACKSLAQRMAELHVVGVSVAVEHGGRLEWARGFGLREVGGKQVDAETMFQAGSISKPLAAMAALKLVEQGKLKLDADVNTELTSWKLPESPAEEGAKVTLRELLTHTAGTTVHGFPGYAVGEPVPTLVQVLNGEKPANTAAIRVETKPGTKWNYSGGGYTIK